MNNVDKARQLSVEQEIDITKTHESYLDEIAELSEAEQRTSLIQKVHALSRDLFIERKQRHELDQAIKQKEQIINIVSQKLTEQATSFSQLAKDLQQGTSSSLSSSSGDLLSASFNHAQSNPLCHSGQTSLSSLTNLAVSSSSFAEFEAMLRSTQEEIDSKFVSKTIVNPHRPADNTSQSSRDTHLAKQSAITHNSSFYDTDGELTRRGRAMVGSIFSMFANNGQSMSFDELTRLHQAAYQSSEAHSSDNKSDDDDELLWCLWQSHASNNENDGEASLSEEDLASVYVREKEFDVDQHARALGLIVN